MIKFGGIELALGLQQIFTSRFDVRGETTPTGAHRDDGKEEVKVSMYKENITTKHFLHHIQGKLPALGLVPIRPGTNDCKWGCIDIDEYNFDGNFIESQAFAYLAIRSYLKLPISFPSTTRCKKAISGGDVFKNF